MFSGVRGHGDLKSDDEVAAVAGGAVETTHAVATQPQRLARLGAVHRHVDRLAPQRGHVGGAAKEGAQQRHADLAEEVVTLALEHGVGGLHHLHNNVAGRRAQRLVARAGKGHACAGRPAWRALHRQQHRLLCKFPGRGLHAACHG
jgi:hypothetical protein